jgi:hypothetical protein
MTQLHAAARGVRGLLPAHHLVALLQSLRSQDISLLTIYVVQQRNPRRPVRIVFDGGHFCWHVIFIPAEIYQSVAAFVTTPAVTRSNVAMVVTTTGALLRCK